MKILTSDAASPAIQLRSLTKAYGNARGIVDVDLVVDRGEVFGFIGPNGAGKTTTIRVLLDFIRASSGSAEVLGLDAHRDSMEIRRRVGYLSGEVELFDHLTAQQLLSWLCRLRGCDDSYAKEVAERLALDTTRRIADLSAGNRQKIGLIQAFMHRPELLILDEPTAGLDPIVQREFRHLVSEVSAAGATVFMSSHVLTQIEALCHRVAMIVGGRVREVRTVHKTDAVSRRHVRLVFESAADLTEIERHPGVTNLRGIAEGQNFAVEMDVTGAMDLVIKWAADQAVVDMVSSPASLDEMFLEAYTESAELEGQEPRHES